ncbi:Prion-like-(Q/N-rich)-domain-bearing protein [Ditylenchus destructor]|nr:Prion-like-(Q/N-rich)-domain-bearing protein [Ditylenchus destructor]
MLDFRLRIFILFSVLLCATCTIPNASSTVPPALCSPAQRWTLDGRDLVKDYKGHVLLVSFMPLTCGEACDKELQKYETIVEKLNDEVRVLIVARASESAEVIRSLAIKYPAVRFEHETTSAAVWSWFGATNHSHFIFDRCSRLAKIVTTEGKHVDLHKYFHEVFSALKLATTYASCGWCQYDEKDITEPGKQDSLKQQQPISVKPKAPYALPLTLKVSTRISPTPEVHPTKITISYVRPRSPSPWIPTVTQEPPPTREPAPTRPVATPHKNVVGHQLPAEIGQQPAQYRQNYASSGTMTTTSAAATSRHYEQQRQRQREEQARLQQQQMQQQQYRTQDQRSAYNAQRDWQSQRTQPQQQYSQQQRPQQPQRQQQQTQPTWIDDSRNKPTTTTPVPIQYAQDKYASKYQYGLGERRTGDGQRYGYRDTERQREYDKRQQELSGQPKVTVEPAPLYPEGSENFDYYEEDSEWTTPTPQRQIPAPTTLPPMWPTQPMMSDMNKDYGLELPCASYTDEICYQQQTQLKPNEIHKCCKERVLLTDQCVSGKCSNITQQLCCIQRFLQAKLSCCLDERQLEETKPGDRFSRCCYKHFVTDEDGCCTRTYASAQWRSVHELCLPNVEMDLGNVKVPMILPGTTLTTEYDFGKTEKWKFECKYGRHVPQFSYFEDEEDYDDDAKRPYSR